MTIFSRNKSSSKADEPQYISGRNMPASNGQEESSDKKKKDSDKKDKATDKKEKTPAYKIVCLPLDTRSGRVLLVNKSENSNNWVLPKTDDAEVPQPEATAHAIAANIVGVEGRLTNHIGEFTQSGKKRVKAYVNAYEFQVMNILSEYQCKESRGRRWFTYVEAMHILSDKPFQQNILRKASIAPKF
ncbi:hypothetical protein K450DRAFT_230241 [Umbelopsis ramanniana AG]|uniref:Nudix hydrolase domain-containing protein n=1 Tax=Umbelopsis ramanniana AG TaxID=1314678 RepID=A0AAD5HF23_UMBRA|nr:uncharacterized protein K450DRAFT_230241 [Umbelopsis ramanniana AG]KAI8581985.1 hypothetical protein K450DRAFT_230241 [Umbelopsis ramanniana AG]